MKNYKKYAIFGILLLSAALFLAGCNPSKESVQQKKEPVQEKKLTAQAQAEFIDISATVQSETEILLEMDNHQEDLSPYDYVSQTTLDGQKSLSWKIVANDMGGHHIEGILIFEKIENPKVLQLKGLPTGAAILTFTKNE